MKFSITLSCTTAENEKIHLEPEMKLNFIPNLKTSICWLRHRKEKRHKKDKGTSYTEKYQVLLLIGTSTINADMV